MTAPAAAARPGPPSLTRRVLRNVLLPLAVTWLAGTAVVIAVANHFTEQAFDRALLDDAYAIAANVEAGERGVELVLSPRETDTVLFDQSESVYFAVLRPDGSLIGGRPGLDAPQPVAAANHRFSDVVFDGRSLRAVTLAHGGSNPWRVVIAQTQRARNALVERLLLYSMVPQLALLGLLAAALWRVIRRDLRPLMEMQSALDRRDVRALEPLSVTNTSRELDTLTHAINALLERLTHSVGAQREFAGNVAHELRTPLAGIRALAEYGLAQHDPPTWREQLERIAASEVRASHLVDQLLGLALADEAGFERQTVRLDELVRRAVLRHLAAADAKGVDLGASGLDHAVAVEANAVLLEGIVDNLVDNALRYGGPVVTIELSGRTLSVVDDGPGIPEAVREGLTQRWSQGPAGRSMGRGAGLGLAIVARYAELLDAELDFGTGPQGRGLRVSLSLSLRGG
ncbi:MAG: sensor histidine kinase [Comamonadaceae bacterium]|nr:MAG: sensor histidine kinase [Comamonadaceae bacterium]